MSLSPEEDFKVEERLYPTIMMDVYGNRRKSTDKVYYFMIFIVIQLQLA